jgi:hypothetical protein
LVSLSSPATQNTGNGRSPASRSAAAWRIHSHPRGVRTSRHIGSIPRPWTPSPPSMKASFWWRMRDRHSGSHYGCSLIPFIPLPPSEKMSSRNDSVLVALATTIRTRREVRGLFRCPCSRALTRAPGMGACGPPSASAVPRRHPAQMSGSPAVSGPRWQWSAKSLRHIRSAHYRCVCLCHRLPGLFGAIVPSLGSPPSETSLQVLPCQGAVQRGWGPARTLSLSPPLGPRHPAKSRHPQRRGNSMGGGTSRRGCASPPSRGKDDPAVHDRGLGHDPGSSVSAATSAAAR